MCAPSVCSALRPLAILPFISPPRKTGVQVFSSNPFSQMGCPQGPDSDSPELCTAFSPGSRRSFSFYQAPSPLPYGDASLLRPQIPGTSHSGRRYLQNQWLSIDLLPASPWCPVLGDLPFAPRAGLGVWHVLISEVSHRGGGRSLLYLAPVLVYGSSPRLTLLPVARLPARCLARCGVMELGSLRTRSTVSALFAGSS